SGESITGGGFEPDPGGSYTSGKYVETEPGNYGVEVGIVGADELLINLRKLDSIAKNEFQSQLLLFE
ncbi:MAG: hypothetical protein AAFS03_10480, partial [Pseudomonadota bacterium]